MRLFYILFLIILCALCQSCVIDNDSKEKRGSGNDRGQRERPSQSDENGTDIAVPVEAENQSITLIFEMNSDNTVLTVKSETPNEKLFVSSSIEGTIFTKTENHIGIKSADLGDGLSLNFDLGQDSLVQRGDGQSVKSGDQIAETKDVVKFYIENQGQKVPFCVNKNNVINHAPEYVTLKISEPETPCE